MPYSSCVISLKNILCLLDQSCNRSSHSLISSSVCIANRSFASTYNSIPANVFGLDVVYLLTWQYTWYKHLWILVVFQISLQAFLKPVPPSVTTILGEAIRCNKAFHAAACSYLHTYHPNTCVSSQHINTHAFRPK